MGENSAQLSQDRTDGLFIGPDHDTNVSIHL